nr:hypothetical protein [Tanacetum cinerariifolium]
MDWVSGYGLVTWSEERTLWGVRVPLFIVGITRLKFWYSPFHCALRDCLLDYFACPASFPWHTAKHVIKDPTPATANFNAQDYATLVAHPSLFQKFSESFLCLVGLSCHYTLDEETNPEFVHKNEEDMDLFAFIYAPNPTKVRVVERERDKDEPRLLKTTVLLLLVAPDRSESELEASVDRLFDESDSGKRKSIVVDTGGASHPPKKLREDHGTPRGASIGASISTTLERKDGDHTGTNVAEAEVDSLIRSSTPIMTTVTTTTPTINPTSVTTEKVVEPSLFGAGSSSAGGTDPIIGAEVRMCGEYNIKEKRRLKSIVDEHAALLKDETNALKECNAILEKERDALDVKNDNLMDRLEKFQDDWIKIVEDKFDKLYTNFVEMTLYLEDKFYPHHLTTISGRRWLLTHGIELAIAKCLNLPKYLFALITTIGKVIEKGMQDRLATEITHGKEGRVLMDVAAHNPSAEADYVFALRQLQNILLLKKLGLNELQPHVDQLMVPIHSSPDKVVIGATTLSLALDASSMKGTSGVVPATATTTTLSTTLALTSSVNPISIDDYEFVDADDQAVTGGDATSFPNVDDAELRIP